MCNVPEPAECVLTDETAAKPFDLETRLVTLAGAALALLTGDS